ncbi:MAG: ribosomal RNA small subunit methyltransferase A [Chlamydiales bacterium]|nr:ribosomal RNA small subunit methyltransferase A [Chlamydiia bacterium]MCP5506919.1 ribosomal RNA small subunit methyltransferase A [Chlamydiales bacterium]
MPLYKPSELRQFLQEIGIHPKKAFSQNFLIDGNIIKKIVRCAEVKPGDIVLEIGPGPGALTEELLAAGAQVLAVEKDRNLAQALHRLDPEGGALDILEEDILDVDIEKVLGNKLGKGKRAKLIANLPYNITTPILARFVPMQHLFESIVVMVQDEVGRRFTAVPGGSEYGSFTVFLNFYCIPEYAFTVSNNSFYPVPKVQSAVVKLLPQPQPHVKNIDRFFMLTRTAFEQRRKMLRGSLRKLYPSEDVVEALVQLGKNPEARPQELSVEDFINLYHLLSANQEKKSGQ